MSTTITPETATTETPEKAVKVKKELRTIDFAAALMAHTASGLFANATIDDTARTAETPDVTAEVGVVTTKDANFDQETLIFRAKTDAGIASLSTVNEWHTGEGDKEETPLEFRSGLFSYALGLRIRNKVAAAMKQAAAGPEKAIAKGAAGLETAMNSGAMAKLTPEQQEMAKMLLAAMKAAL